MTHDYVAIVRRGYEEYAAGRLLEYVERFAAPEFELDMSKWGPAAYTYRGTSGFRDFLDSLERLWERFDIEPIRLVGGAGKVVAIIRVDARGRGSGVAVTGEYGNVWTFQDGRLLRAEWFDDPAHALDAVGLPG